MTAIVQALSRYSHVDTSAEPSINALKIIAILCGAGPCISLMFATYGLDVSYAFF